jgi:predicted aconitase with swiveling domain
MTELRDTPLETIQVRGAFGAVVEGVAVVSEEGFSPRYDLDRWTGVITKRGHKLEGVNIHDKILFFPSAKGGVAAGWAFFDIKQKGLAPLALVFGVTNPVMVQGALFANITITEGLSRKAAEVIRSGDWVRVDPPRKVIELLRRSSQKGDE